MDYWNECISAAFDEEGITATPEQIDNVAGSVEVAHENYGMHTGPPPSPGPDPRDRKIRELEDQLRDEQKKRRCPVCKGLKTIDCMDCWECNGTGRVF